MANEIARQLRKNLTAAEQTLWSRLRFKQLECHSFRRQAPIGDYVVDFVCFARKLIVEVDGGQHAAQAERDTLRTAWLKSQGFRVIRFWNNEVQDNADGVVETILAALQDHPK
jgi:very-short-patch-repair endonuclease